MAIDDAYITTAEYKALTGKPDSGEDAELDGQLKSVSRWIEQKLGRVFNQSAAATARYFDGWGDELLVVDDLVSVDSGGIAVDTTGDGTYDTTFDPAANAWVVLKPYNAAEIGEPYTSLELLPLSGNSTLTDWPDRKRGAEITGTWGWPAVPGPIELLTAWRLHDLRGALAGTPGGMAELIDAGIDVGPAKAVPFFLEAQRLYSRRSPAIA